MTKSEEVARHILSEAVVADIPLSLSLLIHKDKWGKLPELTQEECRAVALNYPHHLLTIIKLFGDENV